MSEPTIQELKDRLGALLVDVAKAKKALREAEEAEMPFHVGDVVEAYVRGVWQEAIVREMMSLYGNGTYKVSLRKVSGDWSLVSRYSSSLRPKPTTDVSGNA